MTKNEYTHAVRKAQKIFGYIQIANSKRPTRLSKAKALSLISQVSNDAQINAEWATDEQMFLLVG